MIQGNTWHEYSNELSASCVMSQNHGGHGICSTH